MANKNTTYSIDDLAALSGHSLRTVRYYVQEGLVSRPEGEKRAACYGAKHLDQLLTIRKWRDAGLGLERIRELLTEPPSGQLPPPKPAQPGSVEVWSRIFVSDGVEISLEPGRSRMTPEQVRAFTQRVITLFQEIQAASDQCEDEKKNG